MTEADSHNGWVLWGSLLLALLLSVAPVPFGEDSKLRFLELGRPLWLALFLSYWVLALPHRIGMVGAWCLGLVEDVLYGTLLGQNALILTLTIFLVLSLQRRMQMFPMWQQSLVLLVVFGIAQLLQLWLNALAGGRPHTLEFILPALISALLWPWVFAILRGLQQRFGVR